MANGECLLGAFPVEDDHGVAMIKACDCDDGGSYPLITGRGDLVFASCSRCYGYVALGPANDTLEALVEARAAEIATGDTMSYDEAAGWWTRYIGRRHEHGEMRPFLAGYLAHAIDSHDAEQRDALDVAIDATLKLLDERPSATPPVECTCNHCCYARKHPQLGIEPHGVAQ